MLKAVQNRKLAKGILLKIRRVMLGNREKSGVIPKFVVYFLLINIGLIYINPLIYMVSTAIKGVYDILDSTIGIIPRDPTFTNIRIAFEGMKYLDGLKTTLLLVLPSAAGQLLSCAIAGYAFARMDFPFKKALFILLIILFIIPPQTIIYPLLLQFRALKLLNTPLPLMLPALFGHGLKAPLFVIIYMQYFKTQPREIEDAARIDGAGPFRTYWKVMFPMAKPAMIVVFLFSIIWHWNETFLYVIYCPTFRPLSLRINDLNLLAMQSMGNDANRVVMNAMNSGDITFENLMMAGCLLTIIPTIILFAFTQKWFTQGIERTGLVE